MSQTMEETYNSKTSNNELSPAELIKEGSYYAACLQDSWYRVKVLSSDLGNKYRVSLVDHGETEEVVSSCIYPLGDEWTYLPAQVRKNCFCYRISKNIIRRSTYMTCGIDLN